MQVTVNNKCIGCNICVDIAEGVFEMVNGKSIPTNKADLTDRVVLNQVKIAVDVCPVQAIEIKEA
jgi:ferredoxin